MLILGAVVAAMGTVTVYDLVVAHSRDQGDYHRCGVIFKCTQCGDIQRITIRDLQKKMPQLPQKKGPLVLTCKACGKNALTHAVECPNCTRIFVIKINPTTGAVLDDHCPKCKKSYTEAWTHKYRNSQ